MFTDPSIPSVVREDYYDPERNIVNGNTQPLRSRYPQPAASIKAEPKRYAEDFVAIEGEGLTGQRKYTQDPEVSADERQKYVDKYKYWTHPFEADVRITPGKWGARTSKISPAHYFVSGFKNPLHGFDALSRVYNSRMDALRVNSPQTYTHIKNNGYINVPLVSPRPIPSIAVYADPDADASLGIPDNPALTDSAYAEVVKPIVTKINQPITIKQNHDDDVIDLGEFESPILHS